MFISAFPKFLFHPLALGDVVHDPVREMRTTFFIARNHGLVADPDLTSVRGNDAIFAVEFLFAFETAQVFRLGAGAVIGMDQVVPQSQPALYPFFCRDAKYRFHLLADEQGVAGIRCGIVNINNSRDFFHQGVITFFALSFFGPRIFKRIEHGIHTGCQYKNLVVPVGFHPGGGGSLAANLHDA